MADAVLSLESVTLPRYVHMTVPVSSERSLKDAPLSLGGSAPDTQGVPIEIYTPAGGNHALLEGAAGNFYYRIWIIPRVLDAINPKVGTPIVFKVWNAYPWPNTLTNTVASGNEGLICSLEGKQTKFSELEWMDGTITIGQTAPSRISADYVFHFEHGQGEFYFRAATANFVAKEQQWPVVEIWKWDTNILDSYDGSEQRIRLRNTPRRILKVTYPIQDHDDWVTFKEYLFTKLQFKVQIPFFQYMSPINKISGIGDDRIYFDPRYMDVRDGETILAIEKTTLGAETLDIKTLENDGAVIGRPLSIVLDKSWVVVPAYSVRIDDNATLQMGSITGHVELGMQILDPKSSMIRSNSDAKIIRLDELPVLHKRPLVIQGANETARVNYRIIDNQTGKQDFKSPWDYSSITRERTWHVKRIENPEDMDWWRHFLNEISGSWKPFLLSSWRPDALLAKPVDKGAAKITLQPSEAFSSRSTLDIPTYIHFQPGEYRRIKSKLLDDDGFWILELTEGVDEDKGISEPISFVDKVRISDDKVTWTHECFDSFINLTSRSIRG